MASPPETAATAPNETPVEPATQSMGVAPAAVQPKYDAATPAKPKMSTATIAAIAAVAVAAVVVVVVVVLLASPIGSGAASSRSSSTASSSAVASGESGSPSAAATTIGQQPAAASSASASASASAGDYVLADSATRYYSRSEFQAMDLHDLYLARNEIYARHGRGFKNADLQSYFNSKSWYTQRYTPEQFESMASPLNDYERANAELMLDVEKSRNSPYL